MALARSDLHAYLAQVAEEMRFDYHEPTSIREAVELGARFGGESRFLAGGTDLMIQIHRVRCAPRQVVSLHRVPGLAAMDVDGAIAIGALVTHRRLERAPAFQGALRTLVESAAVIGGHQIRNVATVGGNVVNASPAADMVPVLLALEARVTCLGPTVSGRCRSTASRPGRASRLGGRTSC